MRKILTRFASVFMALAMILLAVPTVQASADETTIKVHFKNTQGWSSVGVYSWDDSGDIYGGWPGTDISDSKDGDWYTATLAGYAGSSLNIIFNDFGAGQQTVDLVLDLTKGLEWWVVPSDNSTGKWACVTDISKDKAENGKVEVFEPIAPSKPTIKKSPVIDGNKVTFYYECTNADTVAVAGDMNGWSMTDWTMKKEGNVYSYTCEVPAGTYGYKFVVNGQWYADPVNPDTIDDGYGGLNSSFTVTATGGSTTPEPLPEANNPVIEGGKVTFKYEDANASKVEVFGDMNGWGSGYEMTKDGDVFTVTIDLYNGQYAYKFVVDGDKWINDPENPNKNSVGDNIFVVTDSTDAPTADFTPTITESVVIDGNKVTIYYESPTAYSVELFGSMNGWDSGYQMTKEGNVFSITLDLTKGEYSYKFVVDGEWINDPLNENQVGGNNVFSLTAEGKPSEPSEDEKETETQSEQNPPVEEPATSAPMSDGVIILISAIVTIVVVLGGFAVYLFIKKKNA